MRALPAAQRLLIDLGLPPGAHLASGMEGHVFALGGERIAKVWHDKRSAELTALRTFYELLENLDLPFATPVIETVADGPEGAVSIERFLPGTPMSELVSVERAPLPTFAIDAIMSVLAALRDRPIDGAQSSLPIVGVVPSDTAVAQGGVATLLDIVSAKVARFGDHLRRAVQDFDEVYAQTIQQVQSLSGPGGQIVHGDLCPPNILLGPDLSVSAVIDWGFLSHIGDASLDASIACGTYDMYGPLARQHDAALVSVGVNRYGFDRHRLLIYRAVYAILTSNAYAEDGGDGHFAWCVATLNRADIRRALAA